MTVVTKERAPSQPSRDGTTTGDRFQRPQPDGMDVVINRAQCNTIRVEPNCERSQSRRARLRPEEVNLPSVDRRRVAGLRREEVAALAGVGITWYTMFETGTAHRISDEVVASVARALRLSQAERRHLVSSVNVSDIASTWTETRFKATLS